MKKQIKPVCDICGRSYDPETSTAENKKAYCSQACEVAKEDIEDE